MANGFSNMTITERGLNLLAKTETGANLQFTRIAVGDGILNGQDAKKLFMLINEIMSVPITTLITNGIGGATIGGTLTNHNLNTGFYWREVGIFANDPQLGEILYGYDNATGGEIYIPDKNTGEFTVLLNIGTYIANASNVTAVIDDSIVFAKKSELNTLSVQVQNITAMTNIFAYKNIGGAL